MILRGVRLWRFEGEGDPRTFVIAAGFFFCLAPCFWIKGPGLSCFLRNYGYVGRIGNGMCVVVGTKGYCLVGIG